MSLQSNAVSHWLGTNLESALIETDTNGNHFADDIVKDFFYEKFYILIHISLKFVYESLWIVS